MQSRTIRVERTARYYVLGEPSSPWSELWFCLHGYGQQARRFLAEFEGVAGPDRLLVAPEGLSRFYLRGTRGRIGASWMTSDGREEEIADYIRFLDSVRRELIAQRSGAAGEPKMEGVLGFSQGTATAGRLAVLGERRPERLVLWGGGFPPDVPAADALARTRVDLVVGDADEHLPTERVQAAADELGGAGIEPRVRSFEGGHHLDSGVLSELFQAT